MNDELDECFTDVADRRSKISVHYGNYLRLLNELEANNMILDFFCAVSAALIE